MAAGDLTTLINVKQWLGVQSVSDDDLLTREITAASQYIQKWLNRIIASTIYTETLNGSGSDTLILPNYPVAAVSSLVIGTETIPASPGYGQPGYVFDDRGVYLTGYQFCRAKQNVFITYAAGYVSTPLELEQAVIETIAIRYRERDRIGMTSKSMAGETTAFMIKDFPPSVLTILNNWRKVIPI